MRSSSLRYWHCRVATTLAFTTLLIGASPLIAEERKLWQVDHVVQMALEKRPEITAARERVEAARARPAIVSALEDPMLSPSIDHYPFDVMKNEAPAAIEDTEMEGEPEAMPATTSDDNGRYDWNISIEQRFPLSKVLSHRRDAAVADISKVDAEAERTALEIELDAVSAFYMLNEKRRMANVVDEQIKLAHQFVSAASGRYSAGNGNQSEVLRVEVEVARLESSRRALQEEIRAAETMLNTSVSRAPELPVPELVLPALDAPIPPKDSVVTTALTRRPELRVGNAEIARAGADIKAMQAMYAPMGMVRLGYSSTMAEGRGAMLMVGVSLPIWREKLRSGVSEARAMERMARADYEGMLRMVKGEAVASRDQLSAAQIQYLTLRDEVVPRARRLIGPTLSAYASGQGSLLAVIEAAQALWGVQAEAVMAESTLGLAWARFHRMIGITKELPL